MEEPESPLITPDGHYTSNDRKQKSDEFARHLRSVHQTPNSSAFDSIFSHMESLTFKKSKSKGIKKIGVPQFRSLLQETKSNSAPGEDHITYDILKLCSDESIQVICNLFNECLDNDVFSDAWKKASVNMIVKPGKDKNEASSYRPISLLSCHGRIRTIISRRCFSLRRKQTNYFKRIISCLRNPD